MRIKKTLKNAACTSALLASGLVAQTASAAEFGMGLRAGLFTGFGADIGVGFTDKLTLRATYNYFEYGVDDVEDTDVTYDADIEISTLSAFLDWHAFAGSFRFTLGAVGPGRQFSIDGTPAPGTTVDIGDSTYTAAQIGSFKGDLELGDSVAPYFGIGWGNIANKNRRVSFLADIGVIYTGAPVVSLTATCGPTLTAGQCSTLQNQLQADIAQEKQELEDNSDAEFLPVINVGIGIRF